MLLVSNESMKYPTIAFVKKLHQTYEKKSPRGFKLPQNIDLALLSKYLKIEITQKFLAEKFSF